MKTDKYVFDKNKKNFLNEGNLFTEYFTIKKAEISPEKVKLLHLDDSISNTIDIEIRFILDHRKFHPNPVIRIYGIYKDEHTKFETPLHEIEFWDWYKKKTQDSKLQYTIE